MDHFATNRHNYLIEAGTLETSFTDHYLVFARRKIDARSRLNEKVRFVETRTLLNYDKDLFLADLQSIDWTDVSDGCTNDLARMADTFSRIFSSVLEVHAPLKRRRISKKSTPWIKPQVKRLMRERDQLKTRATNDSTLWPQYKVLRNKVTNELPNCVQKYYHTIIEENSNDPKEIWRTMNKVFNKDAPSTFFTAVNFQGQRLDRLNEIAEAFNEYFVTIGPKRASSIEQGHMHSDPERANFGRNYRILEKSNLIKTSMVTYGLKEDNKRIP